MAEQRAVAVMPIADGVAWHEFMEEISAGNRGEAHRAMLRREGVRRETVFQQQTPAGDVMVLVWDGVSPEQMGAQLQALRQNPASDHERYLRDYVIPKLHGVDATQRPPAPARRATAITV